MPKKKEITRFDIIRERLGEENPDALLADGFEDALIGIGRLFSNSLAVYDRARCIEILVEEGMTEEDAEDHFEYNVQGSYVGENTPIFLVRCEE
jgi:hypothetical protein